MRPVVVIGAGPQGLAAAAHLLERGLEPLVLETGTGPAASVAQWGHVRLFSAWPELIDASAKRLLEPTGWTEPAQAADGTVYPTGAEWIERYLAPLADALGERVRCGATVTGVGRKGRDLSVDAGRANEPFIVNVALADGTEERVEARAVIDASGTWTSPNPAGAEGLPALGEVAARETGIVASRIPTAEEAAGLDGRHIVVVGNGHSAAGAITTLADVVKKDPSTKVTWVLRRGTVGNTFGGGAADELPERGALGKRAGQAVRLGDVEMVTAFRTERIALVGDQAVVTAEDGRELPAADQVYVLTGARPNLDFLSEIRLDLDLRLQAPAKVAAEVDPNEHSCGSVRATGAADLVHPEPDFFIVGAKSYGRAPTFLALTGYEQVRSVVALLAGDKAAAERIELVLPDTGVCGGAGEFDAPAGSQVSGGCCAPAPQATEKADAQDDACCSPASVAPQPISLEPTAPR
ncbi:NAD(P)-binding domain-containing protein [Demequina sediminicola]|uniref:NAD(P)-binding domain-containing protein n=1 Tax=Demequina sediminicola TaxID=1095026 RepID=UPI0009E655BB|nr:NAD(P)-binding domain-containing protein [Demequina sediminicola]